MYDRFTYFYHKNQPNVGKYTIHGWYGIYDPSMIFSTYTKGWFCWAPQGSHPIPGSSPKKTYTCRVCHKSSPETNPNKMEETNLHHQGTMTNATCQSLGVAWFSHGNKQVLTNQCHQGCQVLRWVKSRNMFLFVEFILIHDICCTVGCKKLQYNIP